MRLAVVLVGLAVGALPSALRAQQDSLLADSTLAQAARLATGGQGDSARALVRARLRAVPPGDSLFPGVLYAAGLVAVNADSALNYFRRVSIEYSTSRWAAPSLLRLAQYAYATGDFTGALTSAQRVLTDYPVSPARPAAAYWAGRAQIELKNVAAACGLLQLAEAEAGTDVETANQARFYLQRCSAITSAPAESTATAANPPAAAAPAKSPPAAAGFEVQVAAIRSAAAADELMRKLRQYGYDPRVVRDPDGLFKVRVGHYRTRTGAQRVVSELKRRLGGTPFVVEEP